MLLFRYSSDRFVAKASHVEEGKRHCLLHKQALVYVHIENISRTFPVLTSAPNTKRWKVLFLTLSVSQGPTNAAVFMRNKQVVLNMHT